MDHRDTVWHLPWHSIPPLQPLSTLHNQHQLSMLQHLPLLSMHSHEHNMPQYLPRLSMPKYLPRLSMPQHKLKCSITQPLHLPYCKSHHLPIVSILTSHLQQKYLPP